MASELLNNTATVSVVYQDTGDLIFAKATANTLTVSVVYQDASNIIAGNATVNSMTVSTVLQNVTLKAKSFGGVF